MSRSEPSTVRKVRWPYRDVALPWEPDILLASQHATRHQLPADPERRLMAAVIETAVHDWQRYTGVASTHGRGLRADAKAWLWSNDRTWPFSFANICDQLGVDPDWIRRGLLGWRNRVVDPGGIDNARAMIRHLRALGWTQRALSRALGIATSTLADYARGRGPRDPERVMAQLRAIEGMRGRTIKPRRAKCDAGVTV